MKMRKIAILCFLIALLAASAAAAKSNSVISGLEPLDLVPVIPKTDEEIMNSAQLVVYGQIISIYEQPDTKPQKLDRKITKGNRAFTANVKVFDVFKGSADDQITIQYTESDKKTKPPKITFVPGEKCILYLVYADGGRFTTVTPTIGKEYPSDVLLEKLRGERAKDEAGGKVTAILKASQQSVVGGPVYVTLTIVNNSNTEYPIYSGLGYFADFGATGPDGKSVESRNRYKVRPGAAAQAILLEPGHFVGARIDLTNFFNFASPGTYVISARIQTPAGKGGAASSASLVSNSVSVIVVEKAQ